MPVACDLKIKSNWISLSLRGKGKKLTRWSKKNSDLEFQIMTHLIVSSGTRNCLLLLHKELKIHKGLKLWWTYGNLWKPVSFTELKKKKKGNCDLLLLLPLMVGWPKGMWRSPRWSMQLRCSYVYKMLPHRCVVHISHPRPVRLMAPLDRPPLPCMLWLSCKCTKPRH